MGVQVASKLPDQFSVLFIIGLGLEGLVFNQEFTALFPGFLFHFSDFFLKLMALRIELHFDNIKLSLCLVVLLAKSINLMLLSIKFNPMPAFNVFLNLHSHDISVDR